jgi:RHS repeat-associated protein
MSARLVASRIVAQKCRIRQNVPSMHAGWLRRIRRLFSPVVRTGSGYRICQTPSRVVLSVQALEERLAPAVEPSFRGGLAVALGDVTGDGIPDLIGGSGPGFTPTVAVYSGVNGAVLQSIHPFESSFLGGVYVGAGDTNGDGRAEVVVAAGSGGGPVVVVYDPRTGDEISRFFAYSRDFRGGVRIAVGDIDGDGVAEIVTAAGPGGGSHIRVFDGFGRSLNRDFFAYDSSFRGGAAVATGDVDGDGKADIITAPGGGGGPHVKVFSGADGSMLESYFASASVNRGGAWVAAADVDGNGLADVVVGAGAGDAPEVSVFAGHGVRFASWMAYAPDFKGGVRVAANDLSGRGFADIVTGAGEGGGPHITMWDGYSFGQTQSTYAVTDGRPASFALKSPTPRAPLFDGRTLLVPSSPPVTSIAADLLRRFTDRPGEVGLFQVDDAAGSVSGLNPGDPGYLAAAFADNRAIPLFATSSASGTSNFASLTPGSRYAVFLIRGGSLADWLAHNPQNNATADLFAVLPFPATQPAGADLFRVGPRNRAVFEDTPGGDNDRNDALIGFRFVSESPDLPVANTAPTLTAVGDQTTTRGVSVGPLSFVVSDAETPAGHLAVTVTSSNPNLLSASGIVLGGAGAVRILTLTPGSGAAGTVSVTLRVTDEAGATAESSFDLVISHISAFPKSPPLTGVVGRPYTYQAANVASEHVTYSILNGPENASFDPLTGYLAWIPDEVTDQQIVLEASTGGETEQQQFIVTVTGTGQVDGKVTTAAQVPPAFVVFVDENDNGRRDPAERFATTESEGGYSLPALNPGTYPVVVELPAGWEAVEPSSASRAVTVVAGQTNAGVDFSVRPVPINHPPIITSTPPAFEPGETFTYAVTATDVDGDSILYSLVAGPALMTIDQNTGVLTWDSPRDTTTFQDRAAWQAEAGGAATTTLLHFDGPTAASGLAVNDPQIAPSFESLGVRFLPFAGTDIYPVILRGQGHQIPDSTRDGLLVNTSSPNPGDDLLGRAIRFEFTTPAYAVGIATNNLNGGDGGYMRVYDASGNLLAEAEVMPGVFSGVTTTVPIATVEVINTFDSDFKFGIWEVAFGTKAPTYEARVRVEDGNGGLDEQAFVLTDSRPAGRISGSVWEDRDGSGTQELDEASLAGVSIYLDLNRNGRLDDGEPNATTAQGGAYAFTGLAPGTFTVGISGVPGRETTAPVGGLTTVTLAAGQAASDVDFGVKFLPNADNRPPSITSMPPLVARIGQVYSYVVGTNDPDGDPLTFILTEAPAGMGINAAGVITWPPTELLLAPASVTVTATDPSGATATQSFSVTVLDPSARPAITIASPVNGSHAGLPVDVIGTIASPGGQVDFYKVFYARADLVDLSQAEWDPASGRLADPAYVLIGEGEGAVANGRLASFDPTVLPDDDYTILVAAFDVNGRGQIESVQVSVTGGPKIGQFKLTVIDLQIPVAGIPITVAREYDTHHAGDEGDFGYGWRFVGTDARIRETVPQVGDGFFTTGAPFRVGTRVYLTNAEGKREGFTFQPVSVPTFLGAGFKPRFVPDPGVTDQLTVDDFIMVQKADGTFAAYLFGYPFNPDSYHLTTKEGLTYSYEQFGGLKQIRDRNGVTLTFSSAGIVSSTGVAVQFIRDNQGRIAHIIDPDGNAIDYGYDDAGDLRSVTDRNDLTTSYSYRSDRPHYLDEIHDPLNKRTVKNEYDVLGRLIAITDALGNRSTQAFDPDNFTETITDALGKITTLVYDARGNVVRETNPLGHTTIRQYDANDNEIVTTDPLGRITTRTFDDRRNLTSITDAMNGVTRFEYNAFNQITKVTDALGRVTRFYFDERGNPTVTIDALGQITARSNDSYGRVLSETDANGNATSYEYSAGITGPTRIIHPDRTFRSIGYDSLGLPTAITDENGSQLILGYDDAGRLLSVTASDGGITRYGYTGDLLTSETDPMGSVTRYGYDAANRLISKTDAMNGITLYGYDAAGRLISTTDPRNNTTLAAYDDAGRIEHVTDALGNITIYEYDVVGNRIAVIDARGNRQNYFFDDLNRLIRKDNCPCPDEIYDYDAVGNLIRVTDKNGNVTRYHYDALNRLISRTDALGGEERYGYDALGNQISEQDANGNVTRSEFDSRNRLIRQIDPAGFAVSLGYDGTGNQIATIDQLGYRSAFTYDGLGRLLTTEDVLGNLTVNDYDLNGSLVSATNPLGHAMTYEYDSLRRQIKVTDAEGGIVTFEHDENGNRTALTDQVGNRTTFVYDALNRQVRETDPLGHSIITGYDEVGNRIEVIDRNGHRRSFDFDELNRLSDEKWWDGSTLIRTIHSTYDSVGNLKTITDPDSSYAFTYDELNRQTSVDNAGTPGAPRVILTSNYDAVGNRIQVQDNRGVTVDSVYNSRNLLTSRNWSGGGIDDIRIAFAYDERGQQSGVERASDLAGNQAVSTSTLGYDVLGRQSSIVHTGAGGVTVASYRYRYDAASRLIREVRDDVAVDYGYDRTDQLLSADRSTGPDEAYSYDLAGNRTMSGYQTGQANRLITDGTFRYEYDFEGNLVRKTEIATGTITDYAYDNRNRLTAVTERTAGGIILSSVSYQYDALNRRIATTANGVRLVTVHDGDATWADYDTVGVVSARYLTGDVIDEMVARFWLNGTTAWYLTDRLGSILWLLGPTGATMNRVDYDSFGRFVAQANPGFGDRFTFTGRELDVAAGLYYYRARFYHSFAGRFVSEDPVRGQFSAINPYSYVANRPTMFTDPSGAVALLDFAIKQMASPLHFAVGFEIGGLLEFGLTNIVFISAILDGALLQDASDDTRNRQLVGKALDIGTKAVAKFLFPYALRAALVFV